MESLTIHRNPLAQEKFDAYPEKVKARMEELRNLILETAAEIPSIHQLEETLKWGEPSYLAKKGSTIRIDWKSKSPDQFAIYFKCTSKLVPTFREVYGDLFTYENNRAILFELDEPIPSQELKACIKMALTYHTVKHMPLLGAKTQ